MMRQCLVHEWHKRDRCCTQCGMPYKNWLDMQGPERPSITQTEPSASRRFADTGKQIRFEQWCLCVDKWASRHRITRRQAISILFYDQRNPDNPSEVDLAHNVARGLYWAEANDFAAEEFHGVNGDIGDHDVHERC